MNKEELVYTNFSIDRLQEAVKMMYESYEMNHPFVVFKAMTKQAIQQQTRISISQFYEGMEKFNKQNGTNYQFLKILLYRNQIVAMCMVCEYHTYLENNLDQNKKAISPFTKPYSGFTKQQYPKNSTLMARMLIVRKDFMKYKIGQYFLKKVSKEWLSYGFKYIVGMISNPISKHIVEKMGGQILPQIYEIWNGIQFFFYPMKITNPKFINPKL